MFAAADAEKTELIEALTKLDVYNSALPGSNLEPTVIFGIGESASFTAHIEKKVKDEKFLHLSMLEIKEQVIKRKTAIGKKFEAGAEKEIDLYIE